MGTTPVANDLPAATQLAVERTYLAHERTQMAWVRTATSLISFGFTIYKFFEFVRGQGQAVPRPGLVGPREFAMIMISTGIIALIMATIAHLRSMRAMRAHYGSLIPYSLSTVVAGLISLLGGFSLLLVYFRQ